MSDNANTAIPKEIMGEEMNNKGQNQQYEYDVFISYRREHGADKAIAIKVYLEQCGRKVYMDTFDHKGGDIYKEIPIALKKSRNLIVVISSVDCFIKKQDGNGEDLLHCEISSALEQKKNIVPVYYDVTCNDLINRKKKGSIDNSERKIITEVLKQQSVQFHNDNPSGSLNQINKRLKNSFLWKIKNNMRFFIVLLFMLLGIALSIISLCNQYEENDNLYASNNKLDNINEEIEKLRNTINEPYIVFVGGGSVRNYLLNKGIDIKKHPNCFYVNLPSGNACNLLEEEVIKQKRNTPFTFIFLSAELIDKKSFEKHILEGIKNDVNNCQIRIMEIKLGEDTLVVYKFPKTNDNRQTINMNSLYHLLKDSVNEIWSTRDNSGTLNKYKTLLMESDGKSILDSVRRNTFLDDEESGISSNVDNTKPKVYLGSQNYKPKLNEMDSLKVIAGNSKNVKDLYLYILAFKDNDGFTIDTAAYNFLKEINKKDSVYINEELLRIIKPENHWNSRESIFITF